MGRDTIQDRVAIVQSAAYDRAGYDVSYLLCDELQVSIGSSKLISNTMHIYIYIYIYISIIDLSLDSCLLEESK